MSSWPQPLLCLVLHWEAPPTLQLCAQIGGGGVLGAWSPATEKEHTFLPGAQPALLGGGLNPVLAPPSTRKSPFSAFSAFLLCLSPFQGFISLQGTQVTELLPDPEDPGRHLFEITPGRPRGLLCAEGVLVAPWGHDCAPAPTILILTGRLQEKVPKLRQKLGPRLEKLGEEIRKANLLFG